MVQALQHTFRFMPACRSVAALAAVLMLLFGAVRAEDADKVKGDPPRPPAVETTGTAETEKKPEPMPDGPAPLVKALPPSADSQREILKFIKQTFEAEYAKQAPADRLALAAKLFAQADDNANDADTRFVLLREGVTAAAQAGGMAAALSGLDKLEARYTGDLKFIRTTALTQLALAVRDPQLARTLASLKTLVDQPNDAAASTVAGKYFCFVERNWEKGVPFLARGVEPLKTPARDELAALSAQTSAPVEDKGRVADGWWAASEKEAAAGKAALQQHAADFYRAVLPSLGGLPKARAEARIISAQALLSSVSAAADSTTSRAPSAALSASARVSDAARQFAAARAAQSGNRQVAMTAERLKEFNGGKEPTIKHRVEGGQVFMIELVNARELTSIEPLFGWPLKELKLHNCTALSGSLAALKGMPLTKLDLWDCQALESLDGIEGMPLTEIYLHDNYALKSISQLKGMRLTKLDLWGCRSLESLAGIEGMPLTEIILHDNYALKSIAQLKGMPLIKLDLWSCRSLESLAGIEGLSLTELCLHDNHTLKSITPLKGMPLTKLDLHACRSLESLAGIEGMPLREISCGSMPKLPASEYDRLLSIPTLTQVQTGDSDRNKRIQDALKARTAK